MGTIILKFRLEKLLWFDVLTSEPLHLSRFLNSGLPDIPTAEWSHSKPGTEGLASGKALDRDLRSHRTGCLGSRQPTEKYMREPTRLNNDATICDMNLGIKNRLY